MKRYFLKVALLLTLGAACGVDDGGREVDNPSVDALGDTGGAANITATGVPALDALLAELPTLSAGARAGRVEAFLNDQAYSAGGFPLREGNRAAFVFFDATNQTSSIAVAGDFNNWTPGSGGMTRAITGLGFFYRVENFGAF